MTNAGLFGIAPQTALEAAGGTFYWFPMINCDFGPLEGQDNIPFEIGGSALQRGRFKTGVVFGGNLDLVPRLDNRLGWLLHAGMGDASTIADTTVANAIAGSTGSDTDVHTHRFYFKSTDEFYVPYVTAHKLLPHETAASQVGEIAEDCVVTGLTLTATPAAVVTMRASLLGRATADTVWDYNPAWTATYDTDNTFMVTSCTGSVKIEYGDPAVLTTFKTGAVTMTLANNVLPPAQSRYIGSGHPIDFPVLSRTFTVVTTCFCESYDLYVETFGGAGSGGADATWSCTPASGDIDITLQSAAVITGSDYHLMRIRTYENNVNFMARPIVLTPNAPVVFQLVGQVQKPSGTGNPVDIWIQNGNSTGYTWPT
jgi:hypothetical protein